MCKIQGSLFPHNKTYIETNQIEIWKMSKCGKENTHLIYFCVLLDIETLQVSA